VLFSAVFLAGVKADDPSSQILTPSQILSLNDPDGTPVVISHPQQRQQATAATQNNNSGDNDWLLKTYEQELKQHSSDQSNNLYYKIATDKNLSRVAGISTIDTSKQDAAAAMRTGINASGRDALSLRPDGPTAPTQARATPTSMPIIKPLITPLGAADAAGLKNFYSLPQSQAAAYIPASKSSNISGPDLDMPGKVAAENDPLSKASLRFDSTADDALPNDTSPGRHLSSDALPDADPIAQLQNQKDAANAAPTAAKTVAATPQQQKVNATPVPPADDVPPQKLTAPPSPGRQAIANPFSILGR